MYRRPSSNVVTPNMPAKNQRQSRATASAMTVGKLNKRRSSSASGLVTLPNTVGREPRASSVGRYSITQSVGRPSVPFLGKGQTIAKDPRPVGDKAYQAHLIQKMLQFLDDHNYSGTPLAEKQLQSPTRQHFISLLTFLYRFIDERYEYKNQPIETEFPDLLKPLGYPLFSIKSSVLKSFNAPQYWPFVLAAVSWLREVVEFGLNFDFEKAMFPASEKDYERNGGSTIAYATYMYYCQSFVSSEAGSDNFDEFEQMLADQLDSDGVAAQVENLTTENERLKAELNMLESKLYEPRDVEESIRAKQLDIEKVQNYLGKMDDYMRVKQRDKAQMLEEKAVIDDEIEKFKGEIQKKKTIINKQGMKPADVQRVIKEKEELLKCIASCHAEKQDLEKACWDIEKQVAGMKQPLEAKSAELTKKAKTMVRGMPALRQLKGELEISPFAPNFLHCVKEYIWPWINDVKKIVLEEMESADSKNIDTQNQIAQLKIQLRELELDLNQLEKKIQECERDVTTLPEVNDGEYQRLREQKDGLEVEYESVLRQTAVTRTAKEQQLAELTQEYEEKEKHYAEEREKIEDGLERIMQLAQSRLDEASAIRDQVTKRVEKMRDKVAELWK